jgi:hypothetical protein
VDHATAERKSWVKFGAEKGNKSGPDRATTTVGEAIGLKLSAGHKVRNLTNQKDMAPVAHMEVDRMPSPSLTQMR